MTALHSAVSAAPVAGGLDIDLPGRDVRLRATRWPGSGTPVLLLHGLASTRRIWDLVVPGLAGHPVLALDQRRHGESDWLERPYDGEAVVEHALTTPDAVGLSRVVVVGHSWGAWTALRLAAVAPSRVLAVVAVDGGTLRWAAGSTTREQLTPPRTPFRLDQPRELLRSGPFGPWWSPQVEAAVLSIFGLVDDGLARARLPFEAHMKIVDDPLDANLAADLARVRCSAWLVLCSPGTLLTAPRTQRWDSAVHDVPPQWPALVAGLVRAAADEVSYFAAGEGA